MGRKSNERIIFEWMESHRANIGEEAFNRVVEILKEENPEAILPRRSGKKPATDDPGKIVTEELMNELADYSALPDIFNLFGNRGKDLARLAICLMEIGFFRSENGKKKRFEESEKAIHNLICKYKDFPGKPISYELFHREIKEIREVETAYPQKKRGEDKKMMLEAIEIVKEQYEDYYKYLLTDAGWGDKDY